MVGVRIVGSYLLAVVLLAAGCAGCSPAARQLVGDAVVNRPLTEEDRQGKDTRLLAVPAYLSRQTCCGLAALWMVMDYWTEQGGESRKKWLEGRTCPPKGYSVKDLAAMAEARGFKAYVYQGRPSDLARQLGATRPVIVLLRRLGRNHFVVVAGQATGGRWVVNDPARGTVFLDRRDLMEEWESVGRPAILLAPRAEPAHKRGGKK